VAGQRVAMVESTGLTGGDAAAAVTLVVGAEAPGLGLGPSGYNARRRIGSPSGRRRGTWSPTRRSPSARRAS